MKILIESIGKFWEIARVYFRKHIYLWIIGLSIFVFNLALMNLAFLAIPLGLYSITWLRRNITFGWTTQKIRNLLLYKQVNKAPLTPLENEVIQSYFGKNQRTQIILDLTKKKQTFRKVVIADFMVICLMLTILPTVLPMFTPTIASNNPNTENILTLSGQVIALEYRYTQTDLFGMKLKSASPSVTIVHLHNSSILLDGNIELELGANYTITFDNTTRRCISLSLLEGLL